MVLALSGSEVTSLTFGQVFNNSCQQMKVGRWRKLKKKKNLLNILNLFHNLLDRVLSLFLCDFFVVVFNSRFKLDMQTKAFDIYNFSAYR